MRLMGNYDIMLFCYLFISYLSNFILFLMSILKYVSIPATYVQYIQYICWNMSKCCVFEEFICDWQNYMFRVMLILYLCLIGLSSAPAINVYLNYFQFSHLSVTAWWSNWRDDRFEISKNWDSDSSLPCLFTDGIYIHSPHQSFDIINHYSIAESHWSVINSRSSSPEFIDKSDTGLCIVKWRHHQNEVLEFQRVNH